MGWIGVDFDGTLATYEPGEAFTGQLGEPIRVMVNRVRDWLSEGRDVRIVTARANPHWDGTLPDGTIRDSAAQKALIREWCRKYLGKALFVGFAKDHQMESLWDDRCVQVVPNTGLRADGKD